ncbi:hypothetical protein GCM10023238_12350 [Streptomyces heliomycini]
MVFEPNDDRLWSSIRRNVTASSRRSGAGARCSGRTAAEAFYVKCDRDNNPQESIDQPGRTARSASRRSSPRSSWCSAGQFSDTTSLIDE